MISFFNLVQISFHNPNAYFVLGTLRMEDFWQKMHL